MKDNCKNNTVKKANVILLLIAFIIIVSIIAVLGIVFLHKSPEYDALEKAGSQWVSDGGNISFTVYHENWIWYSSEDENVIEDIWNQRYIGFGKMTTESETVDISCILSDTNILMGLFGYSADYFDISYDGYSVKLIIKEISDTEVVATMKRVVPEANWFSYNVGDEIRLTQVNDMSGIDSSDYEFFVNAVEIANASSANTEITIYEREDIADKLKDFEERQVDNTAE